MKPSFKTRSAIALTVLALVACAEKKQLTEMHDSTERMDNTTKGMAADTAKMQKQTEALQKATEDMRVATLGMADITKTMGERTREMAERTREVNEKTKQLATMTGELYDASRQGAALALRRDLLKSAYEAESAGKKLAETAKYFMAFEFQLWTGYGPDDTNEKRLELMHSATSEFFKDVKEFEIDGLVFTGGNNTVDPLAGQNPLWKVYNKIVGTTATDNKRATFNALAATMHILNRKQTEALRAMKSNTPTTSIYDMVATALKDGLKIRDGQLATTDLNEYEKEVLVNEKTAVKLLQARHNFIGGILLAQFLQHSGTLAKAGNLVFKAEAKWDIKLESYNEVQLEQYQEYMKGAVKTRALLRELGIKPQVDPTLMSFYKGMRMKPDGSGTKKLIAARAALIELIEQFRADEPKAPVGAPATRPSTEEVTGGAPANAPVQAPKSPDVKPGESTEVAPEPVTQTVMGDSTGISSEPSTPPPAPAAQEPAKKPGVVRRAWNKIKGWFSSKPPAPAPAPDEPKSEPTP